jgi:hypothetical protein
MPVCVDHNVDQTFFCHNHRSYHLSIHQLHKSLGNRQAKASAAKVSGDRVVRLAESLEEFVHALNGYPYPLVGDRPK